MAGGNQDKSLTMDRLLPWLSVVLIPFLTIFFSHSLDAGKDEFDRFRYASEVLTNEKSSPQLKEWAIGEVAVYFKQNDVSGDGMEMERAKL